MSTFDIVDRQSWMKSGACASTDPELFFPPDGGARATVRNAKKVCAGCPVVTECLEYALGDEFLFGIWGGTTEDERRQLGQQRRHWIGGRREFRSAS